MMPVWLVLSVVTAYIGVLFLLAWKGDQDAKNNPEFRQNPIIYVLALAVYCTSWTYFGAVGTAVSSGWDYLPIYLGPALVFLLAPGLIRRIADISQRESVTSLSDFLSARYGKSRSLAAAATIAATAGTLPYIALQLKSVGFSFQSLTTPINTPVGAAEGDGVLLTTFALALFVILFGARQADSTKQNAGLMRVLAIEAIIKLAALVAVCVLSLGIFSKPDFQLAPAAVDAFAYNGVSGRFITITVLSMAAIICLPRQFHVAIIERRNKQDTNVARWLFPIYLLATSLVVVPIALAGLSTLPVTSSPDLYVLDLPRLDGNGLLALCVFLGGFSAATGMVIVSTIALSTMISNDLVVPAILRSGRFGGLSENPGAKLLFVKRSVIITILLLAYSYYRVAGSSEALAQTGLLSFAAAVQFAPALIGAVYWRNGKGSGALAGLCLGGAIWAYTLFLPAIFGYARMSAFLPQFLDPHKVMGLDFGDPLTHGVVWSLGLNTVAFIIVSLRTKERLRDRVQAAAYLGDGSDAYTVGDPLKAKTSGATPDGLHTLASRFLTHNAVDHAFNTLAQETDIMVRGNEPADWRLVQQTEKLLASALGSSSARTVLASAMGGQTVALPEILSILDHQTQAARFDRHMLQSMLENISNGISVVDQNQKLVAWNSSYMELFDYPEELLRVGVPIENLIAYNLKEGWIHGDPVAQAKRRIDHMRGGQSYVYERQNPDGCHLRIIGNPMPGGGYVTSFIDITEDKQREQDLLDANELLETRVRSRTSDLESMADALNDAREEAESANASKTRFLAAASHDLLQPLNAARLFLGSLKHNADADIDTRDDMIEKTDKAIQSADDLLKGLLDISRLDHGKVEASPVSIPLGPLLEDLVDEATPMAERAGLDIRLAPTRLSVNADPDFLKSILRNFISNARRYTQTGAILVGARRRGDMVRIEVWDTGHGISKEKLPLLFDEFQRLEDVDNAGIRGAGLGLSIAKRLAAIMDAKLTVRSWPSHGSVFAICCQLSDRGTVYAAKRTPIQRSPGKELTGMKVLCIDDELTILNGMDALLKSWGCDPVLSQCPDKASVLASEIQFDALIADFDLKHETDGLQAISSLRSRLGNRLNAALLTAKVGIEDRSEMVHGDIRLLKKPVNPEDIRMFLSECAGRRTS